MGEIGKRLVVYTFIFITILWGIFFYVRNPILFSKSPYLVSAFLASRNISCEVGDFPGLVGILSKTSLPYFSLSGEVGYLDIQGRWGGCYSSEGQTGRQKLFRFASMTKAITTLAMIDVAKKNNIDLNAAFLDFFPEVDRDNLRDNKLLQVTLNHLLNHSSGFGGPFGSDNMVKEEEKPWCPYDFKALESVRLAGTPGTNHLYSNVAYCLLGEVISRVTGQEFRTYIREHYLAGYPSIDFVDGGFLPDEPEYDFSNDYRLGSNYVEWLDFYAISSAAGLLGKPEELARLVWNWHRKSPEVIFSGPQVEGCREKNLGLCYSYTFTLEQSSDGKHVVAVQQGYMPGASSLLAVSRSGEVVVWTAAGAALAEKYKKKLVQEVVDFLASQEEKRASPLTVQ